MSVPPPDLVRVQLDDDWIAADRGPVRVSCVWVGEGLAVDVSAGAGSGVSRVHLRWLRELPRRRRATRLASHLDAHPVAVRRGDP